MVGFLASDWGRWFGLSQCSEAFKLDHIGDSVNERAVSKFQCLSTSCTAGLHCLIEGVDLCRLIGLMSGHWVLNALVEVRDLVNKPTQAGMLEMKPLDRT